MFPTGLPYILRSAWGTDARARARVRALRADRQAAMRCGEGRTVLSRPVCTSCAAQLEGQSLSHASPVCLARQSQPARPIPPAPLTSAAAAQSWRPCTCRTWRTCCRSWAGGPARRAWGPGRWACSAGQRWGLACAAGAGRARAWGAGRTRGGTCVADFRAGVGVGVGVLVEVRIHLPEEIG